MNKILNISLLILAIIVILVLGVGVGFYYERGQQIQSQQLKDAKISAVMGLLSSNFTPGVSLFGKISKISGKSVTLTKGDSNFIANIESDTKIASFFPKGATSGVKITPKLRDATFDEIKVGTSVSLNIKILQDNTIKVSSITITSNN